MSQLFGEFNKCSQFGITIFYAVLLFGIDFDVWQIGAKGNTLLLHSKIIKKLLPSKNVKIDLVLGSWHELVLIV